MRIPDLKPAPRPDDELAALADHPWVSRLPDDTQWFRGTVPAAEVGGLSHIFAPIWGTLSAETGEVLVSARTIAARRELGDEATRHARAITRIARALDPALLSPLILGANDPAGDYFMILDGNHRAVALQLARSGAADEPVADVAEVDVIVACSRSLPLRRWR